MLIIKVSAAQLHYTWTVTVTKWEGGRKEGRKVTVTEERRAVWCYGDGEALCGVTMTEKLCVVLRWQWQYRQKCRSETERTGWREEFRRL